VRSPDHHKVRRGEEPADVLQHGFLRRLHDADYRQWSEAHRISPELERKCRLHWDGYKEMLQ
jgi:hypothetical protein